MKPKTRFEIIQADAAKFRAKVLQLYRCGKGLSQSEIARRLLVSRARVNQIVRAS